MAIIALHLKNDKFYHLYNFIPGGILSSPHVIQHFVFLSNYGCDQIPVLFSVAFSYAYIESSLLFEAPLYIADHLTWWKKITIPVTLDLWSPRYLYCFM